MKALISLSFLLLASQLTFAQTTTASTNNTTPPSSVTEIDWSNFENELAKLSDDEQDWSFHTDQSNKLLYIDFEALGGKMERLVLKSNETIVVFEDNHLFDLPVNTIYEVNLDKLKRGSYFVELHTHKDELIRREITIQ